jgi:hypothetical protein
VPNSIGLFCGLRGLIEMDAIAPKEPSIEPRAGASTRKCAFCLIVRGLVRVPYEILGTILELMRRPSEFGRQRIDVGTRDLQRALYFYLNLVAASVLIQ